MPMPIRLSDNQVGLLLTVLTGFVFRFEEGTRWIHDTDQSGEVLPDRTVNSLLRRGLVKVQPENGRDRLLITGAGDIALAYYVDHDGDGSNPRWKR